MARPSIATAQDVRGAVLALLAESGVGSSPSPQSFRRAVSVRKVRERLGGGNPATIGRAINSVESEIVQAGLAQVSLPGVPPDIAELMQQLWRAAVAVQIDEVARLRNDAQAVADDARAKLTEAELRAEMLKQELGELRAAAADRDTRLAQVTAELASRTEQLAAARADVEAAQTRAAELAATLESQRSEQQRAVASAQERYEALSRRLLEETAQQRQSAQAEVGRLTTQLKFAEKRQAAIETRHEHLEQELLDARAAHDKATGEVAALQYVNTSLRAQVDEIVRALPAEVAARIGVKARKKSTKTTGKTPKSSGA